MKHITLKEKHCKEVRNANIIIGGSSTPDDKRVRFTFNSWTGQYKIWLDGTLMSVCIEGDVQAALDDYNLLAETGKLPEE